MFPETDTQGTVLKFEGLLSPGELKQPITNIRLVGCLQWSL